MGTRADPGWQRRDSRYLFESPWYRLRRDTVVIPPGERIDYTLVEHPGTVQVVALLDGDRVLMERVYRYPLERYQLECPSGGIGDESPRDAACRELEEETGYLADTLTPLGSFTCSPGISDEVCHVFLAEGVRDGGRMRRDRTEQMEVEAMPLATLVKQARSGEMFDAMTALSVLVAEAFLSARRS